MHLAHISGILKRSRPPFERPHTKARGSKKVYDILGARMHCCSEKRRHKSLHCVCRILHTHKSPQYSAVLRRNENARVLNVFSDFWVHVCDSVCNNSRDFNPSYIVTNVAERMDAKRYNSLLELLLKKLVSSY